MNTKDRGTIGELIVAAEAVKRGYTVCLPYGENQRYDLVLDRTGNLERVQVKCLQPKDGRLTLNMYTVMHDKDSTDGRRYRRERYTHEEVDLMCIINADTKEIAMIPIGDLDSVKSQAVFRIDGDMLRKSDHVRLFADYSNW